MTEKRSTPSPKRRAKPKIEIDIDKVEALASRGLSLEQIAASMGISYKTLARRRSESSELSDAIKRGKDKGVAVIANKLFEAAKNGNTPAMIFFLKVQGGWKETQRLEGEMTTTEKPPEGLQDIYNALARGKK